MSQPNCKQCRRPLELIKEKQYSILLKWSETEQCYIRHRTFKDKELGCARCAHCGHEDISYEEHCLNVKEGIYIEA